MKQSIAFIIIGVWLSTNIFAQNNTTLLSSSATFLLNESVSLSQKQDCKSMVLAGKLLDAYEVLRKQFPDANLQDHSAALKNINTILSGTCGLSPAPSGNNAAGPVTVGGSGGVKTYQVSPTAVAYYLLDHAQREKFLLNLPQEVRDPLLTELATLKPDETKIELLLGVKSDAQNKQYFENNLRTMLNQGNFKFDEKAVQNFIENVEPKKPK